MMDVEKTEETFVAGEAEDGLRLDKFLADAFPDCSRAYLQRLIGEGDVEVDGRLVKQNHRLIAGSTVVVAFTEPERPEHLIPEDLPLEVVYEDRRHSGHQQTGRHGGPSSSGSSNRHGGQCAPLASASALDFGHRTARNRSSPR